MAMRDFGMQWLGGLVDVGGTSLRCCPIGHQLCRHGPCQSNPSTQYLLPFPTCSLLQSQPVSWHNARSLDTSTRYTSGMVLSIQMGQRMVTLWDGLWFLLTVSISFHLQTLSSLSSSYTVQCSPIPSGGRQSFTSC